MTSPVQAAVPVATGATAPRPKNVTEAAQQFEALLIAQMLKAARGDEQGGWLGSGDDPGSATAAELAEEQFAQALAKSGGLGLSAGVVSSLTGGTPGSRR